MNCLKTSYQQIIRRKSLTDTPENSSLHPDETVDEIISNQRQNIDEENLQQETQEITITNQDTNETFLAHDPSHLTTSQNSKFRKKHQICKFSVISGYNPIKESRGENNNVALWHLSSPKLF